MNNFEHWEQKAKQFGTQIFATTKCKTIKQLENYAFSKHIKNNLNILEIGCGNGLNIVLLAKQFPNSYFVGMDYSQEMIAQARKNGKDVPNAIFVFGNATSLNYAAEYFDMVLSDRCIINIQNTQQQKIALSECYRVLKPNGKLLLLENTQQAKDKQNDLRECFGLTRRPNAEYNLFIDEAWLIPFLKAMFNIESIEQFAGLHDLALYILGIIALEKEPIYDSDFVKKVTEATIKYRELFGSYPETLFGQNKLFVCTKHDGLLVT